MFLGDGVLAHLELLEELLAAHHDLCLNLYSGCVKPKLHYMRHLAKRLSAIPEEYQLLQRREAPQKAQAVGTHVLRGNDDFVVEAWPDDVCAGPQGAKDIRER